MDKKDEAQIIRKLSVVGIAGNLLLTSFKLFAGIVGKSGAMVSDAVHSSSDVMATLIATVGVRLSRRAADDGHPYGHERMESVATLMLGIVLIAAGLLIGKNGVSAIVERQFEKDYSPGLIAVAAAVISIITKEAMFWYTRHYAKIMNSSAFMADAWHHRSDAMSSIGSLAGIAGARLGYPVMDPMASIVICLFILKVALTMLKEALSQLVDQSCSKEYNKDIESYIKAQDGVVRVDALHSRKFGNRVYIDLEIAVSGNMALKDAHDVAQHVHDKVEQNYPDIKHIMIHLNPA